MSIFFMTALLAFALFELLAKARPWESGQGSWGRSVFRLAFFILALFAAWFLTYAIFAQVHPPFGLTVGIADAFFGRNALTLTCGAIVGVLFWRFFNKIYSADGVIQFSLQEKFTLAMLILFLFLGMGGEEVLRGLAQRVTKLSAAGVEIGFVPSSGQRAATGDPGRASNPAGAPGSAQVSWPAEGSATGLGQLSQFETIISRDEEYIGLLHKLNGPISERHSGITIGAALDNARHAAKLLIVPIGECIAHIYSRSADGDFTNSHLQPLLYPLRRLAADPEFFANEDNRKIMLQPFMEQVGEIIEYIYASEVNPKGGLTEYRSVNIDAFKDLAEGCADLLYIYCTKIELGAQILDDIRVVEKTINSQLRADWLSQAKVDCPPSRLPLKKEDLRRWVSGKVSMFSDSSFVKDILSPPYEIQSRPYLSILIASIMAQLGHYEGGLTVLQHWQDAKALPASDRDTDWRKWLSVRALSTITALTEEWMRKQGSYVSSALREYHIHVIEQTLALYDELFGIEAQIKRSRTLSVSWENLEFRREASDHNICTETSPRDASPSLSGRLFNSYVSGELLEAHHALFLPDYATRWSPHVGTIVDRLMRTDFSCMQPAVLPEENDRLRAESLGVFARMKLADAAAAASVRSEEDTKGTLKKALAAVSLGLSMVRGARERDLHDKISAARSGESLTLVDRISTTRAMDTYDTLSALFTEVQSALNSAGQ